MLLVLLDVNPDSERIPALVKRLKINLKNGYWGTT